MGEKVSKLLASLVEVNADTQPREELDRGHIDELRLAVAEAKASKFPQPLPPADVFQDNEGRFWMADGWHRYFAWTEEGLTTIPVYLHEGSMEDAILFGCGSNVHGKARTNRDKRRVVRLTLAHPRAVREKWSIEQVAHHCHVGVTLVKQMRKELADGRRVKPRAAESNGHPSILRINEGLPKTPKGAAPSKTDLTSENSQNGTISERTDLAVVEDEGPTIEMLAAPYRKWHGILGKMKAEFESIAKDEDKGGHLSKVVTRLETGVEELRSLLYQATPLEPCPKCKGDGCQHCSRTGFWTRFIVDSQRRA